MKHLALISFSSVKNVGDCEELCVGAIFCLEAGTDDVRLFQSW